jgi:hypothetical protein
MLDQWIFGNQDCAGMSRGVSRYAFQLFGSVNESFRLIVFVINIL